MGNFIFHFRGRRAETASQKQEKSEYRKAGVYGGSRLSRKARRKLLVYGIILGVWVLLAVLVPLFWPFSYSEQNGDIRNQAFSLTHWFGTDRFGRDLESGLFPDPLVRDGPVRAGSLCPGVVRSGNQPACGHIQRADQRNTGNSCWRVFRMAGRSRGYGADADR